jgi:hypothetical protein
MTTLEDILERQILLNERLLSYINNQTTTVERLVGIDFRNQGEGEVQPTPNGLIEQLLEAQERTNSLLSLYSYNNGRLRDAVFVKEEAVAKVYTGTVEDRML